MNPWLRLQYCFYDTERLHFIMSASDYHAPRLIDYELGEKIASGGSCDVFVATHKLTKSTVAIKCICKRQARKHNITLEIDALRNLRHANIITLYQVEE